MHQTVAVKVIATGGKSRSELEALSREIEIMSSLSHPHIIQLHGWHQTDTQVSGEGLLVVQSLGVWYRFLW